MSGNDMVSVAAAGSAVFNAPVVLYKGQPRRGTGPYQRARELVKAQFPELKGNKLRDKVELLVKQARPLMNAVASAKFSMATSNGICGRISDNGKRTVFEVERLRDAKSEVLATLTVEDVERAALAQGWTKADDGSLVPPTASQEPIETTATEVKSE